MVNLANVLTNATAATLSAWSNAVPLETYFHFDEASGFGDYYLNVSVIWAKESLYETRIVPAIVNVREWLDDMEANEPTASLSNPYGTSSYDATPTIEPISEVQEETGFNALRKRINCGWFCGSSIHCSGILAPCKKYASYP
ncbi:hypothetical protein SEUBUCD646_0C01320 [Saccharomyces eubayanus]|uniref:Uncharacterized protein n=1 Tax=Saccharomyces eubayanus TaxID=1080349 RepID=A0ABN8VSV1_SACEU|nr:hypothetical protein SEUBUCD650_0C01270 [Saccharomyces eubayanus]CAI1913711.1 hypothetical protein SEUBUCD646_0C01320 [Saccharomyces eubayanus]